MSAPLHLIFFSQTSTQQHSTKETLKVGLLTTHLCHYTSIILTWVTYFNHCTPNPVFWHCKASCFTDNVQRKTTINGDIHRYFIDEIYTFTHSKQLEQVNKCLVHYIDILVNRSSKYDLVKCSLFISWTSDYVFIVRWDVTTQHWRGLLGL